MDSLSVTHYKRACERFLERMGVDIKNVTARAYESRSDRFAAWCAESIWTGLDALTRNDPVLALRCALQAADYVGRTDGRWPSTSIGDAFLSLRNDLELAVACSIRKAG